VKELRELILESMGEIKFSGILKFKPDSNTLTTLKKMMEDLPPEANPLSPEHLHVTLIHQDILKPYKAVLKKYSVVPTIKIVVTDKIYKITRPKRQSWITVLANQGQIQEYVDLFMESLGGKHRPENRIYHVTLANLTGNSFDSVGDVRRADIIGANLVSNVLQDKNEIK
jgi:hypothetical protein